jgi:hypothetical protein
MVMFCLSVAERWVNYFAHGQIRVVGRLTPGARAK